MPGKELSPRKKRLSPEEWRQQRALDMARDEAYRTAPLHPDNKKRCWGIDYQDRNIFHFTLMVSKGIPPLSVITPMVKEDGSIEPYVEFTRVCDFVMESLAVFKKIPNIEVCEKAFMPDHVHLVVYATAPLPKHIGLYIRGFMAGCTSRRRKALAEIGIDWKGSFFQKGYHDRACRYKGQFVAMKNYVRDNYRRRAMIMANPRFFQTIRDVEIGDRKLTVYGNPFLLEHPDRVVVRASSKFSDEEQRRRRAIALDTAAHGGVIVSPFINGKEQEQRAECLALGARMIRVIWQGFGEKFKPAQREIELCAQGRLLLVALNPGEPGKETLHKWMAMEMNRVAESLCDYTQPARWRR